LNLFSEHRAHARKKLFRTLAVASVFSNTATAGEQNLEKQDNALKFMVFNIWNKQANSSIWSKDAQGRPAGFSEAMNNLLDTVKPDVAVFPELDNNRAQKALFIESMKTQLALSNKNNTSYFAPAFLGTANTEGVATTVQANAREVLPNGDALLRPGNGFPTVIVHNEHSNYYDESTRRLADNQQYNQRVKQTLLPMISMGDFNAGDVSERGLLTVEEQAYLLLKTTKASPNNRSQLYMNLLKEYPVSPEAAEAVQRYIQAGDGSKEIPANWFANETYPVKNNLPVSLNVLKQENQMLENANSKELFEPLEAGDGRTTWPSLNEVASQSVWPSWGKVKIDHVFASRPFAKWMVVDETAKNTGVLTQQSQFQSGGKLQSLSDHEPVAVTVRWAGPQLQTYSALEMGKETQKLRLIWGADAAAYAGNSGAYFLTRNNQRNDVYLGQVADENGIPTLQGLTLAQKKSRLDCSSTDAGLSKAISRYCLDDHARFSESVIQDGKTLIVEEDEALGAKSKRLVLNDGTLRIVASQMGSLTGTVQLDGAGGALQIDDASNNVKVDGVISGTGDLIKLGAGQLTLNAENTYSGNTFIDEGRLTINGSIASQAIVDRNAVLAVNGRVDGVTVKSGGLLQVNDGGQVGQVVLGSAAQGKAARLSGRGVVQQLVLNSGGQIAPGHSIGVLNAGDVSFNPGSLYAVEVAPDGRSDRIQATGNAVIAGGDVVVSLENAAAPLSSGEAHSLLGQRFNILSANAGVTGKFDSVSPAYLFLGADLSYQPRQVILSIDRNATGFAQVAQTPNERAVAAAAETLKAGNQVYESILLSRSSAQARQTFNQLTGQVHSDLAAAQIAGSRYLREALNGRLQQTQQQATDAQIAQVGEGGWVQILGGRSQIEASNAARGYSASTRGVLLGMDTEITDGWRLGGATGYTRTTLNGASSASGESDDYHLSLYGGKRFDHLSLRMGAASTWHVQETSRSVVYDPVSERQKAHYTSRTDQVFAEASYNRWENVEPFVNLNQVNFKSDRFKERGGQTSLHSSAQTQNATFSTLGVRGQMRLPNESGRAVTLRGELGWLHQFGNLARDTSLKFAGSNTAFTVNSVPVSRDGALLKLGKL